MEDKHRISSANHPQSNGRAEVAVKSAKKLLRSNVGPNWSLDYDKLLRVLLQLRNSPDPDCNIFPAIIIFGRPIRDSLSFVNRLEKNSNPNIRPTWREAWAQKEIALRTRFTRTSEALNEHAQLLTPLKVWDKVFIQNQIGNSPTKWHRTGTVVEVASPDQYIIKLNGSRRLTKCVRMFLRVFKPTYMTTESAPTDTKLETKDRLEGNTKTETASVPPATGIDITEGNEDTANVPDFPCHDETTPLTKSN